MMEILRNGSAGDPVSCPGYGNIEMEVILFTEHNRHMPVSAAPHRRKRRSDEVWIQKTNTAVMGRMVDHAAVLVFRPGGHRRKSPGGIQGSLKDERRVGNFNVVMPAGGSFGAAICWF